MDIKLRTSIKEDEYTEYVYEAFDIQERGGTSMSVPFNLEEIDSFDWNVGVILGGSGSGKTTILKRLGDVSDPTFDPSKALISNFDWLSPKDAAKLLTHMGLSSVPTWLRPYDKLSNGEQYRAKLAYKVAKAQKWDVICVDEFTSVVDRDVAKAMSFALQKYVRAEGKFIVLASCHYDILEWLMPDWIYSPSKGVVERCDYLRQGRPKIELSISRVKYDTWNLFKKHHYMSESLNKAFSLLLFSWNGKPVAIVVYKTQPTGTVKNCYGLSRTVVLPDYQGLGIGSRVSEFVSGLLVANGKRVFTKTVNPALGEYREKSENWRATAKNGHLRRDTASDKSFACRLSSVSYCHEYVGPAVNGFEYLTKPTSFYE